MLHQGWRLLLVVLVVVVVVLVGGGIGGIQDLGGWRW